MHGGRGGGFLAGQLEGGGSGRHISAMVICPAGSSPLPALGMLLGVLSLSTSRPSFIVLVGSGAWS